MVQNIYNWYYVKGQIVKNYLMLCPRVLPCALENFPCGSGALSSPAEFHILLDKD